MRSTPVIAFTLCIACHILQAQPQWQVIGNFGDVGRMDDLCFVHPDTGWVVTGGGRIFRTHNGGENWTLQYFNQLHYFRSIAFADSQFGFAGTLEQTMLCTQNGGVTWENITNQLPFTPSGVCGMQWLDDQTFFATGAWFGPAFLLKTHNRGATWTGINLNAYASRLVDVHFISQDRGFVCGRSSTGGVILYTSDGGVTWQQVFNTGVSGHYVWKLQFLDEQHAVASVQTLSQTGLLLRSNDGGMTWTSRPIPDGNVQGVGFISPQQGWMCGTSPFVMETVNAGDSWYPTSISSIIPRINRFQVFDSNLVYASGARVFKYSDTSPTSTVQHQPATYPAFNLRLTVFPNPAEQQATVRFLLPAANNADLSLYDSQGKLIQFIFNGRLSEGQHEFPVTLPGNAGTYYVGLQVNEGLFGAAVVRK
jgi:photosystem II stability/assembly factor-like uncharacterized protein